jgi:hypothetical protein
MSESDTPHTPPTQDGGGRALIASDPKPRDEQTDGRDEATNQTQRFKALFEWTITRRGRAARACRDKKLFADFFGPTWETWIVFLCAHRRLSKSEAL